MKDHGYDRHSKSAMALALLISAILFVVACVHRMMLGGDRYVKSPLVEVEVWLLLSSLIVILYCLILALVSAIRRKFKQGRALLQAIAIVSVLNGASCAVDAPTLLYAT